MMEKHSRYQTGQIGEFLVATELARAGFAVALPSGNSPDFDLLAYGHDRCIAVQVKSVMKGNHQFNVGKFVDVAFTEQADGNVHQRVIGPKQTIDGNMLIAFVFVGGQHGDDRILWSTVGDFAQLLATVHQGYLDEHKGYRPGKNKKSLHASVTKAAIESITSVEHVLDMPGFREAATD
jgi:hypothetical protein